VWMRVKSGIARSTSHETSIKWRIPVFHVPHMGIVVVACIIHVHRGAAALVKAMDEGLT